jgi:hypothetical protein
VCDLRLLFGIPAFLTGNFMSKWIRVLRILRQAVVITLITFVLAEIAFRIYGRINPTFIFYGNSYNRFRAKPYSYDYDFRLNSKGFKDIEFSLQKDQGSLRVLGIGDSFAYGVVPYQYNYLTLLEDGLNKNGKKVEVINMGISSTGPRDYLSLLMKEGLELKPDMVIVSFFIGNDFTDPSVEKKQRSVYSYSYVATFMKYLIDINTKYNEQPVQGSPISFDIYDDNKPTFTDDYFVKLEIGRSEIYRKQGSSFEGQFAEAVDYLRTIKEICDKHHIALAVVLIPDEVQVNKALQSRVMQIKTFTATADDFDFTLPNRMLAAKLKELGIDFVELLGEFATESTHTNLYKPADTHWNIAGNKLAAEIIQRDLFPGGSIARYTSAANRLPSAAEASPAYEGFHEATDCNSIKGWAWDARHPNDAVKVEIYDNNAIIDTLTADVFRRDLLDAGKGNGAHAFDYAVPARLRDGKEHAIMAKIAGTEIGLAGTPKPIRCSTE